MPGHQDAWRSEADGSVAAEVGAYRLLVRPPGDARGPVRFVVLRREGDGGPHALVGSGTEPDVRTAMTQGGAHGGPARRTATRGLTITECGGGVMMLPPSRPARSAPGRSRDRRRYHGSMFREMNSRPR